MIILTAVLLFIAATLVAVLVSTFLCGFAVVLMVWQLDNGDPRQDILSCLVGVASLVVMVALLFWAYTIWWSIVQSLR